MIPSSSLLKIHKKAKKLTKKITKTLIKKKMHWIYIQQAFFHLFVSFPIVLSLRYVFWAGNFRKFLMTIYKRKERRLVSTNQLSTSIRSVALHFQVSV